jgi:hypothetical protein
MQSGAALKVRLSDNNSALPLPKEKFTEASLKMH